MPWSVVTTTLNPISEDAGKCRATTNDGTTTLWLRRTVGRIGISQLAESPSTQFLRERHVDKVNHDNIGGKSLIWLSFWKELLACGGVVELVVGVPLLAPESVELGLYQLALVNVDPLRLHLRQPLGPGTLWLSAKASGRRKWRFAHIGWRWEELWCKAPPPR